MLFQSLVVAVSLALAIGSVVDYVRLERSAVGFNPSGLVVAKLQLLSEQYRTAKAEATFCDEVIVALQPEFGINAVAVSTGFPFSGIDRVTLIPLPEPNAGRTAVSLHGIDGPYLSVLGVPLLAGREFTTDEVRTGEDVAIVPADLAIRLFGSPHVTGRQMKLDRRTTLTIVGVAASIRDRRFDQPTMPTVYVPRVKVLASMAFVVVRSSDINRAALSIRNAVRLVDQSQPIDLLSTADILISSSIWTKALVSTGLAIVGLIAWVLSTAGFVAFVSWQVRERRAQLALRLALGASNIQIIRHVVLDSLHPVAIGVAVASLVGFVLARLSLAAGAPGVLSATATGAVPAGIIILASAATAAFLAAVAASRFYPAAALDTMRR
jgi:ABC-type antimicrobial peptide transport system permease subunit